MVDHTATRWNQLPALLPPIDQLRPACRMRCRRQTRRDDPRDRDDERDRVYDARDRDRYDPREGLMHDLDLPRGDARELAIDRDRVYELNGEDSRTWRRCAASASCPSAILTGIATRVRTSTPRSPT